MVLISVVSRNRKQSQMQESNPGFQVAIEGATKFTGGEKGIAINAILLDPTPLTRDNLSVAINGGHITKEQACAGALPGVDGCN